MTKARAANAHPDNGVCRLFSETLRSVARKVDHEPVELPIRKSDRSVNHHGPACSFTDAQILEMRTQHEFDGWSVRKVANYWGLDYAEARRYLEYITKSRLIPKRPKAAN